MTSDRSAEGGPPPRRPSYLAGVRVLELGDGVSGAAAAGALLALGASVDKVVRPAGAAKGLPRVTSPRDVLGDVLDRGKRRLTGSPEPMSEYDVVVCDRFRPFGSMPADPDEHVAWVAASGARAWVSISPFGLVGPARHRPGSELVVAAAGGLLASDRLTGAPVRLGGHQTLLGAGQVAALAACHAIDVSRATGHLAHADVSAQDSAVVLGPVLRLAHRLFRCSGPGGSRRNGAPAGFYRCLDGWVRISAMEDHQFEALCRAVERPAWATEFGTSRERIERADELDGLVGSRIASWTKVECEERMQRAGVPATAMYDVNDLLSWPHFQARSSFEPVDIEGRRAWVIGPPHRSVDGPGTGLPNRPRPSGLAGLRVLEAGHVLAVPLSAALLGALGASVVKLEDPERIDMYRRRGPYIDGLLGTGSDGQPSVERSAYFAVMNHSKASVAVDTTRGAATLDALLEASDVLIENLGARRAKKVGLDAPAAAAAHPHLLAISSSGYGMDGPWSAYRAYAYNLHAACGLCATTRGGDGEPADIDLAWGDLVTAYAIATVVAAWAIAGDAPDALRCRAIDLSMAELLAARFNDQIAASSIGTRADDGTADPRRADGFFATADQRWVALTVATHDEWEAVCIALRTTDQEAAASGLADVIATLPSRDVVDRVQRAGVPVALVAGVDDLLADPHLDRRGLFASVQHPTWGTNRIVGLPWSLLGRPPIGLGPPPVFGSTRPEAVLARVGRLA